MTHNSDDLPEKKSATQTLAELVARRKSAAGDVGLSGRTGRRQAETAAAARSASRSKPALRK